MTCLWLDFVAAFLVTQNHSFSMQCDINDVATVRNANVYLISNRWSKRSAMVFNPNSIRKTMKYDLFDHKLLAMGNLSFMITIVDHKNLSNNNWFAAYWAFCCINHHADAIIHQHCTSNIFIANAFNVNSRKVKLTKKDASQPSYFSSRNQENDMQWHGANVNKLPCKQWRNTLCGCMWFGGWLWTCAKYIQSANFDCNFMLDGINFVVSSFQITAIIMRTNKIIIRQLGRTNQDHKYLTIAFS